MKNLYRRNGPKTVGVGNGIEVVEVGSEAMEVGGGLEEAVEGS